MRKIVHCQKVWFIVILWLLPMGSVHAGLLRPWNNPHPTQLDHANTYFTGFAEPPKTLDPAKCYTDMFYLYQIADLPLQYHFLLRPARLIPASLQSMPEIWYIDNNGHKSKEFPVGRNIKTTLYRLHFRKDLFYAPHPAFAQDQRGHYAYHQLTHLKRSIISPYQFEKLASRSVDAADYLYQLKRLADPLISSPIYSVFADHLQGFAELRANIEKARRANSEKFLDLRNIDFPQVRVIDRFTLEIAIKGYYPQFQYWLATPFLSSFAWEVDRFYSQKILQDHNISADSYPVGAGPYFIKLLNPNMEIQLVKNPKYHQEYYPSEGMPSDLHSEILVDAGKRIPMIDQVRFNLEREATPRWNKFLQGYYDASTVSIDNFNQTIRITPQGAAEMTPQMQAKGVQLEMSDTSIIGYFGVNMQDPLLGGLSEGHRKLRQALAIAINFEEFMMVFMNGSATVSHQMMPAVIDGYIKGKEGINPVTHEIKNGQVVRRDLSAAKRLLAEAGYPNGNDPATGKPLVLYMDQVSGGGNDSATYVWWREQFAKLGIELLIRDTQYNRFQDKLRQGQVQIFSLMWGADYPDAENFLMLFYGPNSKVAHEGENSFNYHNPEYDKLYQQFVKLPDGEAKRALTKKMLQILQQDMPVLAAYAPKIFYLRQPWLRANKLHPVAENTLKYARLDPGLRFEKRQQWNQPRLFLLWVFAIGLALLVIAGRRYYLRRMNAAPTARFNRLYLKWKDH